MRALIFFAALVATIIGLIAHAFRKPSPPELWTYRTTPKHPHL